MQRLMIDGQSAHVVQKTPNLVFVCALKVSVDRLITGEHRYDDCISSAAFLQSIF